MPNQNLTILSRPLPVEELRLSANPTFEEMREKYNRMLEMVSRRFVQGDLQHKAHAGHEGTVALNSHIDLQGKYKIINAAPAVDAADVLIKRQGDDSTSELLAALQVQSGELVDLLNTEGGDDVGSDAAASAVTGLDLSWQNAKAGYVVNFSDPLNNAEGVRYYKIAFFNGSNWLNFEDGSVAADEAEATTTKDKTKYVLHINAANFAVAFNTGLDVKVTPVSLVDGNYIDGTAATFGSLVAIGDDFVNDNDSVNRTTAGVTAGSPTNMLRNGHFKRADGGGNLKLWKTWNGTSTPISSNYVSITTATAPAKWIKASHSLEWSDSSKVLASTLAKQLMPGVKYYFTFWCKGSAATAGLSIAVYYERDTDATNNMDNVISPSSTFVSVPLTGLSTSFQYFGAQLKMKNSPALDNGAGVYSDQYLVLQIVGTLGGTVLTLDKLQHGEGTLPFNYSPYQDEEDTVDLLPSAAPSLPDVGYSIDVRGGFFKDPGEGGRITLYT